MVSIVEVIKLFLAFCGGISVLGAATVYVAKAIGWLRQPEATQNAILQDHERRLKDLEQKTNSDYGAIQELQTETKMMLKAVLAIMKHELDGNNTNDLEKARKSIENYLVDK